METACDHTGALQVCGQGPSYSPVVAATTGLTNNNLWVVAGCTGANANPCVSLFPAGRYERTSLCWFGVVLSQQTLSERQSAGLGPGDGVGDSVDGDLKVVLAVFLNCREIVSTK